LLLGYVERDRAPYITTLRNGTASTIPAWNNISGNFFLANYNPSLAIDNDDGSSFWQHHGNFIVYGMAGLKFDFGAHDMRAIGNYYAYIDVAFNEGGPNAGIASSDGWFVNNTVVVGGGTFSYFGSGYPSNCFLVGKPQQLGEIYGNAVHSESVLRVACLNASAPAKGCALSCPLGDWLTQGYDKGTTVGPLPRDEEIIAAAKLLLKM
jgi:hypothetical protein